MDGGGDVGQVQNVIQRQDGGLLAGVALFCNQGRTEGAHNAGNVRAGGLHPGDLLEGTENGLIVEGAALDHHMTAEVSGVGELDDLVEGVFDDGIG